jgi:hypothetical protein
MAVGFEIRGISMGLFGKKAPKKFGSSKKLVTPEGFTEGGISWNQLLLVAVDSAADDWFSDLNPAPIGEVLQKGALDADEYMAPYLNDFAPFYTGEDAPLAIPRLEINLDDLGEQINLTEGTLGPAIIAALESAGVAWRFENRFPISHFESVEFPDSQAEGISQWSTFFGMPFEQTFRIFRNSEGEEVCLWSSKMLAATRPFEHLTTREVTDVSDGQTYIAEIKPESISKGALTFGEWSTKFFIPLFAKRLFFMAETPFPSTAMMRFRRQFAFGEDVSAENLPRPVIVNSRREYARGVFDEAPNGFLSSGTIMPNVIEMGWTFSTSNQAEIRKILEVATEGLKRIASILEDGYLNHRTPESNFPFDLALLSAANFDADYVQGGTALGLSQWVPVVRLGFLLNETNLRLHEAVGKGNVDEQVWISYDGAGGYVPNAINSLVFSTLIEAETWVTVDRLLDAAVLMEVGNESTNSLSNWGIAKFKQGLVDEAIEKFELALARPDKYSEGEASYWLAEIWEQRGDAARSEEFRARCKAAGGYVPGGGFSPSGGAFNPPAQASGGLSKSSSSGLGGGGGLGSPAPAPAAAGNLAAFCGQCGTKFENAAAKFCGNCGSPR